MKYAHVEFENAGDARTETIVEQLMDVPGYEHITGSAGSLYFAYHNATLAQITERVQAVVWEHNGGMWCDVCAKTEQELDDYL